MDLPAMPRRSLQKRWLKEALATVAPPCRKPGLTILVYHKVGSPVPGELNVPVADFARQMRFLADHATVVSLRQALTAVATGALTENLVVLTFDDGYRNFYDQAYPVLQELNLPSTVYVCPAYVRRECPMPWDREASEAVMGWPLLRELVAGGLVSAGSHTWSHRVLTTAGPAELASELTCSRAAIESALGRPAPDFCYPKSLWDSRTELAVRRHYETAVIGGHRRVAAPVDPFRLYRIPVLLSDTFRLFRAKLAGGMAWEGLLSGARDQVHRLLGRVPPY